MSLAGGVRTVTCPMCETVLKLEIPERDEEGREVYRLPPHVPWLGVNLCLALEVTIILGPARDPNAEPLQPGIRFEEDTRRRFTAAASTRKRTDGRE